jgi:hypothetical protein
MKRYRRRQAAQVLTEAGFTISAGRLAKMACDGTGPEIEYWGRYPTYPEDRLFAWAAAKLSPPVRSTVERRSQAA